MGELEQDGGEGGCNTADLSHIRWLMARVRAVDMARFYPSGCTHIITPILLIAHPPSGHCSEGCEMPHAGTSGVPRTAGAESHGRCESIIPIALQSQCAGGAAARGCVGWSNERDQHSVAHPPRQIIRHQEKFINQMQLDLSDLEAKLAVEFERKPKRGSFIFGSPSTHRNRDSHAADVADTKTVLAGVKAVVEVHTMIYNIVLSHYECVLGELARGAGSRLCTRLLYRLLGRRLPDLHAVHAGRCSSASDQCFSRRFRCSSCTTHSC